MTEVNYSGGGARSAPAAKILFETVQHLWDCCKLYGSLHNEKKTCSKRRPRKENQWHHLQQHIIWLIYFGFCCYSKAFAWYTSGLRNQLLLLLSTCDCLVVSRAQYMYQRALSEDHYTGVSHQHRYQWFFRGEDLCRLKWECMRGWSELFLDGKA